MKNVNLSQSFVNMNIKAEELAANLTIIGVAICNRSENILT